jgi:hypothetical protein
MANKISIALTSSNRINIVIPTWEDLTDIPKVGKWLSDFIERDLLIYSTALLFLFPSITVSGYSALMISLYAITLLVLMNRILRKLFLEGEHFPTVPFDLPLLTLTTFISFSFFYNTAVAQVNTNIWGGKSLQEISGVSLITYWFYYYLLFTSIKNKAGLKKLLQAFYFSPLISILGALIFNLQLSYSTFTVIALLHPMFLYLSLNSKNNSKLHLLNLIISTLFIFSGIAKWSYLTLYLFYLLQIIYLIFQNRRVLPVLFRSLDQGLSLKHIGKYIRNNSTIILIMLSLLFIFLSSSSIYSSIKQSDFLALEKGYTQISKLSGLEYILGVGLKGLEAPQVIQFLATYGLVTGLAALIVFAIVSKQFRKILVHTHDKSLTKLFSSLIIGMIPLLAMLFLTRADTTLFPIVILTMGTIYLLIKRISIDKLTVELNSKIATSTSLSANQSYFLKLMKILLIIIFLLSFIYLLSYLNYINIFINT